MKSIYNYLLIIFLTFSFGGCLDDTAEPIGPANANEVEVSFNVSFPVDNIPVTRQIPTQLSGNIQENMIQKIDILAFKVNPDNTEYFDYYAEGKLISGAGTSKQTFHAIMRLKTYKQRFVIIANAHDEVMQLIGSVEWRQAPKDEMLKMLEFSNKASGHKWNASNTGAFTPFPMWGEMQTPQLITSSTTSISGIPMLRMVAKIDVVVAENDAVSGKKPRENFKLTEVYLYNVKDNGHVVPDRNALVFNAPNDLIVNKPTIPSALANWAGPLKYTTGDEVSLTDEIYTLEAKATDLSKNRLDATGLVIGGYYSKDGVSWDTEPSYYRLDVMTTDKTATRDILRNHNYEVRIIQVKGPGNPTPEIAWNSATPMELIVAEWNIQTIPGNILKRQLNTSAAKISITGVTSSRIYFWSDQSTVKVEAEGYIGIGGRATPIPFTVNNFFDDLSGTGNTSMFHYDPQTGEGYMDVATMNTSVIKDTRRIYLNAGGLKREIVVNTEVKYRPQPFYQFPWVGTFHRSNEVGERIIYSNHGGEWSAEVDDPQGKGSFVILSKIPSHDTDLGTQSPGKAEDYPVLNGVKSVKGKGRIYFRVGMDSKYTPTTDSPVRYATITVKHSGGTATLHVRQGEEADYLMRNGDPTLPGIPTDLTVSRTLAKKISPYNLTDKDGGTGRVGEIVKTKYVFAEYPTQAGYYFQWGRTYAWYPEGYKPEQWLKNNPIGFWGPNWEASPNGYRRPNDGSITNHVSNRTPNNSEVRQSLFVNPLNGKAAVLSNSKWGYYADGFFDRRKPLTSANNEPSSAAGIGAEIAYIGRLLYNPYSGASLFIPASGIRSDHDKTSDNIIDGVLRYTGTIGFFWTTTSYSNEEAAYAHIDGTQTLVAGASRRNGMPVRCIKDE